MSSGDLFYYIDLLETYSYFHYSRMWATFIAGHTHIIIMNAFDLSLCKYYLGNFNFYSRHDMYNVIIFTKVIELHTRFQYKLQK